MSIDDCDTLFTCVTAEVEIAGLFIPARTDQLIRLNKSLPVN